MVPNKTAKTIKMDSPTIITLAGVASHLPAGSIDRLIEFSIDNGTTASLLPTTKFLLVIDYRTLPQTTIIMNAEDESTYLDRGVESANGFLNKLFSSCAEDPKGSVHRAWGISLIFVVVFFVISVIESE